MGDLVYFKANFNNQLIQLLDIIGIAPFPFYEKYCDILKKILQSFDNDDFEILEFKKCEVFFKNQITV